MSLDEAVDKLKAEYPAVFAKRQLTWFRNRMSVTILSGGKSRLQKSGHGGHQEVFGQVAG